MGEELVILGLCGEGLYSSQGILSFKKSLSCAGTTRLVGYRQGPERIDDNLCPGIYYGDGFLNVAIASEYAPAPISFR